MLESPAAAGPPAAAALTLSTLKLAADPSVVALARRFARDVAADHPHDPDVVALVTSELVTNGLRAAARLARDTGHPWRYDDTPVHLGVQATDRWTLISVRDPAPDLPIPRAAGPADETGRGLVILAAETTAVWVVSGRYAKSVRAVVAAPGITLTASELAVLMDAR